MSVLSIPLIRSLDVPAQTVPARDRAARKAIDRELLDCLQLSEKAMLLLGDTDERRRLGFKSAGSAEQAVKDIESLRNNLAHSQDIVATDWAVIARFALQLEEILEHFP